MYMRDEMSFGRYLAHYRRILGLTQEKLAEKLGVSKSAIAKWETDGGVPERDNLKKLADVMSVSVDELHRRIDGEQADNPALSVNITTDIINVLEMHGYRVIGPGNKEKDI